MKTIYKRTRADFTTYNNLQWGANVTNAVEWSGEMCSSGCIHGYRSPELAVFVESLHNCDRYSVMWECRTPAILLDDGLKIGMASVTTIRQIPMPTPTVDQRVEFAIRCAMLVCKDISWRVWARGWLSGKDRTADAARTAYDAARTAYDAADAARTAYDAADAAYAAYDAAYDAAYAARAAAYAAYAAAYAAYAAYAAVEAVDAVADAKLSEQINRIAKRVMKGTTS